MTDIVLFCGFSLCNAIPTSTDTIAGSLLVLTLSEIVVIKVGWGAEHRSKQLNDRSSSINSARTVQIEKLITSSFYASRFR